MKKTPSLLFFLCISLLLSYTFSKSRTESTFAKSPSANTLHQIIQNLRHSTKVDGRLGVTFYSLKQNKYIYRSKDTEFYTPASCLKLLVTATALHKLPPNYFPQTKLKLYGTLDSKTHTLHGNIHVVGGGDPNISGRFFSSHFSLLDSMVQNLKRNGIHKVQGNILADDRFFSGPHKPEYWKKSHFNKWFGAEVSSLSYNDNCFHVTISPNSHIGVPAVVSIQPNIDYVEVENRIKMVPGKRRKVRYSLDTKNNKITLTGTLGMRASPISKHLPIRNPSQYFVEAFKHRLEQAGIQVLPHTSSKNDKQDKREKKLPLLRTFSFQTVPATNILEEVNQRSQNLHAEMLLRLLGKINQGTGSAESGVRTEKQFVHELGLDSADFDIVDGSGLSHKNRVRGVAMTQLLVQMARSSQAENYFHSLATPGVHGVRKVRINHLRDQVRMKTGYIDPVQGLCGYLFTSEQDTLAFSIFLNQYTTSNAKAANFVDSLVSNVANWYNREGASLRYAETLYTPPLPTNYQDRLIYFSKVLEGQKYKLGPTGEGTQGKIDSNPLLNLSQFDCVTYIESVMALAMSSHPDQVIPHLNHIRYFSDSISYATRKHFFIEDWIYKSPEYVKTLRFPKDTTHTRKTGKNFFFQLKGLKFPNEDPSTPLTYVPYEQALELMENWTYGKRFLGVAFVTNKPDWLWVTHTGFLDATEPGMPKLRHASSKAKKVVTQDFKEYLLSRKGKCSGVYFFEFTNPPSL